MPMTLEQLRTLEAVDYIGDGVYVGKVPYQSIAIVTTDGVRIQNEIILDADVMKAFDRWRERNDPRV